MPDPVTALIGGGLGVVSSLIGADAAGDAAATQAQAASSAQDAAAAAQLKMYNQTREDLAPWRKQGTWAVNALQSKIAKGPGQFKASEGYDWTLGQGLQGVQRAASAMGGNRSGAHMKAATEYAQGLASTEYDNFLRRWYQSLTPYQSLAGVGQTAGAQTGASSMQTGNALANIYQQGILGAGQAQAAGQMGQANSLAGGLNWAGQNLMGYGMLNAMQPAATNYIQPTTGSYNQLAQWNPNATGNFYNWAGQNLMGYGW